MPEPLRVLVTGGASGIGLGIARAFANRGDRVHVCGTNEEKLAKVAAPNSPITGSVCDVANEAAVTGLFATLTDQFDGLDVLVNNAGIAGPTARIDDVTLNQWRETMAVNVTGVFLCSRSAAPLLRASAGSIINISSVAGRLGYAYRTPYCASKFAVAGITESLARELGPSGVRVNSILPGFVDSDRLNITTAARAAALHVSFEEVEGRLLQKASLRRKVSEDEIAQMAVYLTSPAGRNISGQSISVCANVEYL